MTYSEQEKNIHRKLMRDIVIEIKNSNNPYHLKGGTSLLLCYGLERFSEDLDFNADKKLNIHAIIEKVITRSGLTLNNIGLVKDTDTVQRYKIHYNDNLFFKIETSFREDKYKSSRVEVDGIQTYSVDAMISMKMSALRNRTTSRDMHDCIFMLESYRDFFCEEDINYLVSGVIEDRFLGHFNAYRQDDLLKPYRIKDMEKLELLLDSEIGCRLEVFFGR